ncbi:hypothetical protein [Thiocapsa bogorovii]|uniref:hypothetical protein n=1 Tax=Thiocapsa bogorovii TaxID=521689 RepID=UPI001E2E122E|nr:hypothetical protein [Thiocapsa bogorovii]UHD17326.1 hypothetical protein LT988_04555 [Thiocapsa bogorovii]
MANKKTNPDALRDGAREKLEQLGYQQIEASFALFDPLGDGSMAETAELVGLDDDEPVILFASGEPGDASKASVQDDAKFKAGLGAAEGKPFRFVWLWDGENDFIFDVEKDAQISALPARDDWKTVARPISETRTRMVQEVSAEYHRGDFRAIQRKFDQLHEAIYSRGGVKPTNAAIDELGKLLFLKVHLEKSPGYALTGGAAKGQRFADIYSADHVRAHKKDAVIQLKDAFREINNLPRYKATEGQVLNGHRPRRSPFHNFPEDYRKQVKDACGYPPEASPGADRSLTGSGGSTTGAVVSTRPGQAPSVTAKRVDLPLTRLG